MRCFLVISAACFVGVFGAFGDAPAPVAKNVIVMIGDGMGFAHVDIGSMYQYGETGVQPYESFTRFACATYSVSGSYDPDQSHDYDYLKKLPNDSAASATTIASGVLTYPGAIGVDPDKNPVKLITKLAEETGRVHGVVASVQFNHATPAAFLAHAERRNHYREIARGMLESNARVIMGAGHPEFDKDGKPTEVTAPDAPPWERRTDDPYDRVGGASLWETLKAGELGGADPWTFVERKEDFEALVEGDTPQRVFGLAQVGTTLQLERSGDRDAPPFTDPFIETVPSLETMALGALNILSREPKGFFLMVEGGAIDWAAHANVAGRMVEEQIDFNKTIGAVIRWVEKNSSWEETLLIITADHECGYVLGPGSGPELNPIENRGKGNLPGFEFHSTGHTNQLVPLYVTGVGSGLFKEHVIGEDPKHGPYVHQASIHTVMEAVMR